MLHLSGGQVVDFAEFHRLERNWKDFKWEVFAYNLHFEFHLPKKSIGYYAARVRLRSDGSVIEEVDLPNIAKHPERGDFVSLSNAMHTVTAAGFDVPRCDNIQIEYRPKYERCVYYFERLTRREGVKLYYKCLDADAPTGKPLRTYKKEARQ